MTVAMETLMLMLLQEAPVLAVKLMAIWTKQGKVTAEEWAAFIAAKWPDAESFFTPIPTPPAV